MTNIFSRFRDIISSNINAMLDSAEDPEKMVNLMIQEMEDTLVEIRAACAKTMAGKKRSEKELSEVRRRAEAWAERAEMAVSRGRENLAREALLEKRHYQKTAETLDEEIMQTEAIIEQYKEEIVQLEEKLAAARDKKRVLAQRHIHAQHKKKAREEIRRFETSDAWVRLEQFENRIARMEAEAELADYGRRPADEFTRLELDEDLENELRELKAKAGRNTGDF